MVKMNEMAKCNFHSENVEIIRIRSLRLKFQNRHQVNTPLNMCDLSGNQRRDEAKENNVCEIAAFHSENMMNLV